MRRLYAVLDTVADAIVGGLLMFPHDAPAVRFFGDLCADPQTGVSRHVEDHSLVCLGAITDENQLVSLDREVVISGSQWLAAQPKEDTQGVLPLQRQA